jgi:hypothetical protein
MELGWIVYLIQVKGGMPTLRRFKYKSFPCGKMAMTSKLCG